jgi:hypothetical protein
MYLVPGQPHYPVAAANTCSFDAYLQTHTSPTLIPVRVAPEHGPHVLSSFLYCAAAQDATHFPVATSKAQPWDAQIQISFSLAPVRVGPVQSPQDLSSFKY